MSREAYLTAALRSTVRISVETILRSQEYSPKFLARMDKEEIDRRVDEVTEEVAALFVRELKSAGYTQPGNEPSENEFESIFRRTLQAYLDEKNKRT